MELLKFVETYKQDKNYGVCNALAATKILNLFGLRKLTLKWVN